MRWSSQVRGLLAAAGGAALGMRIAHSRHRRILHPAGRSFTGELEVWGAPDGTGSRLLDVPGRYPVTVRISRGGGTPLGWPDVLGVAVRVHGPHPADPNPGDPHPGARRDLLFSTAGHGRLSRHLPVPRRSFDTVYGSILGYRTGGSPAGTVYLAVVPDPAGAPLGDGWDTVAAAVAGGAGRLLLTTAGPQGYTALGRITLHRPLPAEADAALAFDPVRNTTDDLHPTGLVHASRAGAYRLGQRWRGVTPTAPDAAAVIRTATHR